VVVGIKANDSTLSKFVEGTKQFIIPLFQRTYSWEQDKIRILWEDITNLYKEVGENPDATHFFGSFVTLQLPSMATSASKYMVIDGQQRLTTVFIFLAALRDRIKELDPNEKTKDEINDNYLTNKYYPNNKYKLVPTQADRTLFFNMIDNCMNTGYQNSMSVAYNSFKGELDSISDIKELNSLKSTVLNRFAVVDINLEKNDDPYVIFESLNAKGEPLTQSDLIRNYLFMNIPEQQQEEIYTKVWLPMQEGLGDKLDPFIRYYLAREGTLPNKNKLYSTFKEKLGSRVEAVSNASDVLKELARFSSYYAIFLNPQEEKIETIRSYLEKFIVLDTSTVYPLFLSLYEDYANKKLSENDFAGILRLVEAYVVRRGVCRYPAKVFNRYFPSIYKSLDQDNIVFSLGKKLKSETGTAKCPNDEEFKESLTNESRYLWNVSVKYILKGIEEYDNKEIVNFSTLQLEHIMPQTLTDEWKEQLGENWSNIYTYPYWGI
jgi:uncharacterized protein with ParB-like and HNH nuclease domain